MSRQAYFCSNKHVFVATNVLFTTKHVLCRYKIMLVVTKLFFRDKTFVAVTTKVLSRRDKHVFVATKVCLSRLKKLSRQTMCCCFSRQKYCHEKHTFVGTKDVTEIILVAAPANDRQVHMVSPLSQGVISSRCVVKVVRTSDRYWRYPLSAPSVRYPQMV